MYKIEKISVNNFKNIVDTNLELGDMNVIVGPNNSGKSNFLQVIPFLKHFIQDDIKQINLNDYISDFIPRYRMFQSKKGIIQWVNLKIVFTNTLTDNKFIYELELADNDKKREVIILKEGLWYKSKSFTGAMRRVFVRKNNAIVFAKDIFFSKNISDSISSNVSVIRIFNLFERYGGTALDDYQDCINGLNAILDAPTFYFSVSELKKKLNENPISTQRERIIWTNILSNIAKIDKHSILKKRFKEILLELLNIDEVEVSAWELVMGSKFNKKEKIEEIEVLFYYKTWPKRLEEFSDGTILLIALITEILSNKNDIIFIEEPENSIHPRALQELIKFMREFEDKKQFIITTHSSTLLNIIKDPGNIIIAEVNEKGESTLRKPTDVKALRKKLSKGFLSLGDLLYFNIDQEPAGKENDTTIY